MNFLKIRRLSRVLSVILVLTLTAALFAGCSKKEAPEDTSEPGLSLDLTQTEPSAEDETTVPPTTEAPEINENTATVTSQINIRSSPSTEATIVGNLYAGDKVEISRRETVTGIDWAYIISPEAGWIVMEFVEMDIPTQQEPVSDTSTPAGDGQVTAPTQPTGQTGTTQQIKGVINANGLNIRSEPSTSGRLQGSYNKGDVVTILETKNGWGRTNKGWIKLEYVSTSGGTTGGATGGTTTNNNATTNVTISGNGSTTVQFRGIVIATELNVRDSASTAGNRIGQKVYGNRVEILEQSGNWGRTKDGWISLGYVYRDGTTGKNTTTGTITATQLNVRSGPGQEYNAVGSYNQGETVTILEQFRYNGVTWGCTNKGWISMQYVSTGAGTGTGTTTGTTATGKLGTVTATTLFIRSGPGQAYGSVGGLVQNDVVTILEQKTVDGMVWGRIAQGWVAMQYIRIDPNS